VVHPQNGLLFSVKTYELSSTGMTWKKLKCILANERSQYEDCVLHDSNSMMFGKKQN
jgi:hypothetical protein